jgi:hypothetical protein
LASPTWKQLTKNGAVDHAAQTLRELFLVDYVTGVTARYSMDIGIFLFRSRSAPEPAPNSVQHRSPKAIPCSTLDRKSIADINRLKMSWIY